MMDTNFLALRIPHLLAQVETRINPALRGRAFVVATGQEPRSQVLGLSPAVSAAGRARGAPLGFWLRWQPGLLVVESCPERVSALLQQARARLEAVAPGLRSPRLGQFLLRLGGLRHLHPDDRALGRRLLDELRDEEGLAAAAGIGPSPLAAQLLARRARAGELNSMLGERERHLLDDFPLAGLPSLPSFLLRSLAETGVRLVGEARGLPAEQVLRLYGEAGRRLRALLDELGVEAAPAAPAPEALHASRHLGVDSADPALLEEELTDLLELVHGRARDRSQAPRRLSLRLVWNDGQVQLRATRLLAAPGESRRQTLRRCGRALLRQALEERRLRVRELTVELSHAPEDGQLPLFETQPAERREQRLDRALGQIRRLWGPHAVRLGAAAGFGCGPGPAA